MLFMKKIVVLVFIFLNSIAVAENNSDKLKKLSGKILEIKTEIVQKKKKHKKIEQQVIELKRKIKASEAAYKVTLIKINKQKAKLASLNKSQARQQFILNDSRGALSKQMNLAYHTEPSSYLKILANDKEEIGSELLLEYHKYIFIERLKEMGDVTKLLEQTKNNKEINKKQNKELKTLEKKQRVQKIELEKMKKKYTHTLSLLKTKIDSHSKKLDRLLVAKRNLEKLIDDLAIESKKNLLPSVNDNLFQNVVWPMRGKVIIRFGSPIEKSSWKWNGVVIKPLGVSDVRAIFPGRVIYADKLSGYGLLIIVDHENGYISLYGYNSSVYVKLNSKVKRGQVISSVGKEGDKDSTLYFAIRYNGKPVDPQKLCR